MLKKLIYILFMIFLLLSLTGCWNRREPNAMAIIDSSVIDIDDRDFYNIILEVLAPTSTGKGAEGQTKKSVIIAKAEGETPPEAIRQETQNLERKLYLGHVRARFFTERLAVRDITSVLDFFLRDHETRQNPYMLVLKGENQDKLYSCQTNLSDSMGQYIEELVQSQANSTSESVAVTTLDVIKDYYSDGKEPVMGVVEVVEAPKDKISNSSSGAVGSAADKSTGVGKPVEIEGGEKESGGGEKESGGGEKESGGGEKESGGGEKESGGGEKESGGEEKEYMLKYHGLAAFKDNRLVGYMSGTEARAYNIIAGKFKSAFISLPTTEDGKEQKPEFTILELIKAKPQIKTSVEDDKVKIDVMVKMEAVITQQAGTTDIHDPKVLADMEERFDKMMTVQIASAIRKAQYQFVSDIFGFGNYVHAQNPKAWERMKDNWNEYFEQADLNVNVKFNITMSGAFKEPFEIED